MFIKFWLHCTSWGTGLRSVKRNRQAADQSKECTGNPQRNAKNGMLFMTRGWIELNQLRQRRKEIMLFVNNYSSSLFITCIVYLKFSKQFEHQMKDVVLAKQAIICNVQCAKKCTNFDEPERSFMLEILSFFFEPESCWL